MTIVENFNVKEYTEDPKEQKFIKIWMEAFEAIRGMHDFKVNVGYKPIVDFILQLYNLYNEHGLKNVNAYTLKADLYHFIGERVDNSRKTAEIVDKLEKQINKFYAKPVAKAVGK